MGAGLSIIILTNRSGKCDTTRLLWFECTYQLSDITREVVFAITCIMVNNIGQSGMEIKDPDLSNQYIRNFDLDVFIIIKRVFTTLNKPNAIAGAGYRYKAVAGKVMIHSR